MLMKMEKTGGTSRSHSWLDATYQIRFKLCVQVYKGQHGVASGYQAELCRPVSKIYGHRHLRSAGRGQLDIP